LLSAYWRLSPLHWLLLRLIKRPTLGPSPTTVAPLFIYHLTFRPFRLIPVQLFLALCFYAGTRLFRASPLTFRSFLSRTFFRLGFTFHGKLVSSLLL
jgi:hypothetical protein